MKNAPSSAQYIPKIVENSACGRHSAMVKKPCFAIRTDDGNVVQGVCDFRAKKFFNGKISPQSQNQPGRAPRFAKKK